MSTIKRKVLIVDDEGAFSRAVSVFLTARRYVTLEASNGLDALRMIDKEAPDLIISDVRMPEMDGFELLKKLKGTPRYSKIPVIILTALDKPENLEKGIELHADFYLTKPVSFGNMIKYIDLIFAR